MGADEPEIRLVRVSTHLLVLTPIRLALGLAGLGASMVVGRPAPALLAFAFGTFVAAIALAADPRYSRDYVRETPPPVPAGARPASRIEVALDGLFPSTFGVAMLAAPALLFEPVAAALLSGVLAGMAALGLIAWINLDLIERRNGYRLYVERPGKRVFAEPRRPAGEPSASAHPRRG